MIAKRDKANVLRPSVEHWRRKGRLALFAVDIDDQLESPALGEGLSVFRKIIAARRRLDAIRKTKSAYLVVGVGA